ncbi:MAG: FAD:protein FMN transferase [Akkermansiaceae bacterium]
MALKTRSLSVWLTLLPICTVLVSALSAAEETEFRFVHPLMGTRFSVVCYAEDRAFAEKAAETAFSIAEEVNQVASDYLPESELSRLASHAAGTPISLSPLLYEILDHSRRLAETTGGTFDPTLGPLTKLWREARDCGRLPEPTALRAARAATGWRHFTLDPESRRITLRRENMAFDLGGVAKGYAADLMLESLAAAGISRAMIAAGGDIRLGDPPPGRDGWRVALQTFDPLRPNEILILANAAVSTSGDLYQSVEIGGVTYSHILDPTTGLGLTRRIAASVVAAEAKFSDLLATAACVLGPDAPEALRELPAVHEVKIHTLKNPLPSQRSDTRAHDE